MSRERENRLLQMIAAERVAAGEAIQEARSEGFQAGLERAAEIVELIPMLTGEQAHKIAERIRNEGDR